MITNMASLLEKVLSAESLKITEQGITHAPTIGAMYEGLTRDILDRTIPHSLPLEIVDGFIEGIDGKLSTQIDCMLVTGSGRQLPYTNSYVWHIKDVIAVFEVKKNLFGRELKESFARHRAIHDIFNEYIRNCGDQTPIRLEPMFRAFKQITGVHIDDYADGAQLKIDLHKLIFHVLVMEFVGPVHIIFGFEGYADEHSLRCGVADLLESITYGQRSFTPFTLPNLIVCRSNSILKVSGYPYAAQMDDIGWPILCSNCENPLRLLIELVWTALENRFHESLPEDKNLRKERLAPLIRTNVASLGEDTFGWIYEVIDIPRDILSVLQSQDWTPEELHEDEIVVATLAYQSGSVDIHDNEQQEYFKAKGSDLKLLVDNLVAKRLLAWDGEHIARPIHNSLATIYNRDGRIYTSGNLNLAGEWLIQSLEQRGGDTAFRK